MDPKVKNIEVASGGRSVGGEVEALKLAIEVTSIPVPFFSDT